MDFFSYIIGMEDGYADGTGEVTIEEGGDYTFTDPDSDGNVVIEKEG